MKKIGSEIIQFRAGTGTLETNLTNRQTGDEGLGLVAKRDLERYYSLLQREYTTARQALTRTELEAIRAVTLGTLWDEPTAIMLWAEIDDANPTEFEQWGIDQSALVEKLKKLGPTASLAIVDAIEQLG